MTKEEAFDLIQMRRWSVAPQFGGGWVIDAKGTCNGDDYDVHEIARTRGTLLTAIEMADASEKDGRVLQVK